MSDNTRQLRYNSILQANLDKIINQGIHFNLKKLDHCSRNIEKYKINSQEVNLKREYMNGRQIIQHLQLNLNELHNCYNSFRSFDIDNKYENLISSLEIKITSRINSFTKANVAINLKFNNEESSVQLSIPSNENANTCDLQIQQHAAKLNDSKERFKQVESLNRDIQELNTLAVDLADLVEEQQEVVHNIEENTCKAADNISDGTKTLIKASAASFAPITCAAVGGAVFGPVGAIIGFKLSTGLISALGASVVTYSVAKFVQNKNNEQSLEDLKSISK